MKKEMERMKALFAGRERRARRKKVRRESEG
jgi:hypothetical protein